MSSSATSTRCSFITPSYNRWRFCLLRSASTVAPFTFASGTHSPWVGFGDAAFGGDDETREVVVPPFGAAGADPIRDTAVHEPHPRALAVRHQRHLDGRRAGWHVGALRCPTEREDDPARRVDLHVLAASEVVAGHVDLEDAA